MKVYGWVEMGLNGCTRREELEIDDRDLEGLSPTEREDYIENYVREWMYEQIEWGYSEESE